MSVRNLLYRKDILVWLKCRIFFILSLLINLIAINVAAAGNQYQVLVNDTLPQRLLKDNVMEEKKPGSAAGLLLLSEVVPLTFDRYIKKADYARISFQTVWHNLSPASWQWDNDGFQTNQIGHPYHGSLFFNAYRSNGYSFWQSAPAVLAGSYLWETFAENQAPAPNDFINTGFGGVVLGEITHRLANRLISNNSRGVGRQASELGAFILNPVNGFARVVNGKWGKRSVGITPDSSKISGEFDVGVRKYNVNVKNPFADGQFGIYGRMKLTYGVAEKDYKKSFNNFYVIAELGQDDSAFINIVSAYGALTGWKLTAGRSYQLMTLSANYDYINNEAFYYSGQRINLNLQSRYRLTANTMFNTNLGAGIILLAAVPDGYTYNNRNYDYGPGLAFNVGGTLTAGKFFIGWNYRGGWMKTVNGNQSSYFLHVITSDAGIKLLPHFFANADLGYFNLHGDYSHLPDVNKTYPYLRISLRYTTAL